MKIKRFAAVITAAAMMTAGLHVTVPAETADMITVTLEVLGDSVHEVTDTDKHTLSGGGLQTWLDGSYETDADAVVLDVLTKAFDGAGITYENPSGTYIESVTRNGVTLGMSTNGPLSGWMYTLNEESPMNGVADQSLSDGDRIVFYYTDDFMAEDGSRFADSDNKSDPVPGTGLSEAEIGGICKKIGDGLLASGVDGNTPADSKWTVIALARSGREIPGEYYGNAAEYVRGNIDENGRLHRSRSTDNSGVILALTALGYDVSDVGGYDLLKGLSDMGHIRKQGINGAVWALIALDSRGYEIPENADAASQATRGELVREILDAQLSDGGWDIAGSSADPDITAMALTALASYDEAGAAVEKGLARLSELQFDGGGFGSVDGASAESCAQVIIALTALGIDPASDTRFVKNGRSVVDALMSFAEDSGFKHTENGGVDRMATEQGCCALAAYYRFLNGGTGIFDMSDVNMRNAPADGSPATGGSFGVPVCFVLSALAAAVCAGTKRGNGR